MPEHRVEIFLILAAPFVGSFLAVLIVRLPEGRPWALARSACPACDRRLGPRDLIPLLSWLLSRGRCRYCGARIGVFYPAVEMAALLIAVWAASQFSGWLLVASCVLGWCLLALAVIDQRHGILPDELTLPLVPLGLVVAWFLNPDFLWAHVLGAALGFAAFAAIAWAYRRLRGMDGLGLGDAKLLAAAGAWLSWSGLASVVLLGAVSALAVVLLRALFGASISAKERIAFGPYLCLAIWVVWLYGPLTFGG